MTGTYQHPLANVAAECPGCGNSALFERGVREGEPGRGRIAVQCGMCEWRGWVWPTAVDRIIDLLPKGATQ